MNKNYADVPYERLDKEHRRRSILFNQDMQSGKIPDTYIDPIWFKETGSKFFGKHLGNAFDKCRLSDGTPMDYYMHAVLCGIDRTTLYRYVEKGVLPNWANLFQLINYCMYFIPNFNPLYLIWHESEMLLPDSEVEKL